MTSAPPVPGTHTILVDPRLLVPGRPLFHVPAGYAITGATPVCVGRGGMMEFKIVIVRTGIDKPTIYANNQ